MWLHQENFPQDKPMANDVSLSLAHLHDRAGTNNNRALRVFRPVEV